MQLKENEIGRSPSKKYFVFNHQLPDTLNKETIHQLVLPIIENPQFDIHIDAKDKCFEIIVYSEENQQKLMSKAMEFAPQTIKPSLKSKKICKNQPCTRKQTCFFTHLSLLKVPLFSTKARSWAFTFWQSKVEDLQLPDSVVEVCQENSIGIQVPSEFHEAVLPFPIYFDSIDSPAQVSFKVSIKSNSLYVYRWKEKIFILSTAEQQMKSIKSTFLHLLGQMKSKPNKSKNRNKKVNKNDTKNQEKARQQETKIICQIGAAQTAQPSFPTHSHTVLQPPNPSIQSNLPSQTFVIQPTILPDGLFPEYSHLPSQQTAYPTHAGYLTQPKAQPTQQPGHPAQSTQQNYKQVGDGQQGHPATQQYNVHQHQSHPAAQQYNAQQYNAQHYGYDAHQHQALQYGMATTQQYQACPYPANNPIHLNGQGYVQGAPAASNRQNLDYCKQSFV